MRAGDPKLHNFCCDNGTVKRYVQNRFKSFTKRRWAHMACGMGPIATANPWLGQGGSSTGVQVSARALINLRFQYLLKCALTVSAHVLRFQYLLTYLVRTNLYSKIVTNVLTTSRLVRTPSKISILT
jgi:hypothetical protein